MNTKKISRKKQRIKNSFTSPKSKYKRKRKTRQKKLQRGGECPCAAPGIFFSLKKKKKKKKSKKRPKNK